MSRPRGELKAEPNLTPILDMVFQLITFFMLVINFKTAELDMKLKLPVIGSARPLDMKGTIDVMLLNIDEKGHLNAYGSAQDNVEGFVKKEANSALAKARRKHPDLGEDDELPTLVVVRADQRTPFALLNKVIGTCQENGFRQFSFKVANKELGT